MKPHTSCRSEMEATRRIDALLIPELHSGTETELRHDSSTNALIRCYRNSRRPYA